MRLLSHDPLSGITEHFEFDASTDTFTIRRTQDLTAIADQAKASFNEYSGPNDRWGHNDPDSPSYERFGVVPAVFLNQMMEENGGALPDSKRLKKFFADNPAFKTRPGEAW